MNLQLMDHVAILSKGWLEKILSGEKTIESRWYEFRVKPYQGISAGDTVYFKISGVPEINTKALVKKALFFGDLDSTKIENILKEYASKIGVDRSFAQEVNDKKYCTLIFLDNVEKIEPFSIDKAGYGVGCAWISVENIDTIKL